MVLLVASRISAPGALLLGEVSFKAGPLRVPEVMSTMVEFYTVVVTEQFVLLVSSTWSGNSVSDTMEGWQIPDKLPSSA